MFVKRRTKRGVFARFITCETVQLKKSLRQRIDEAIREEVLIVPYSPEWPALFEREAEFLRRKLPAH